MGFGFPAAIGAKIGAPERDVVCITGDGGMQMNMQEMATAMCHGIKTVTCIFNNEYLGMVRQMQQMFFGKRYGITSLRKQSTWRDTSKDVTNRESQYVPDFMKWAEAYGALGIRVTEESEILPALTQAKASDLPVVIEFTIPPEEVVLPMVQGGKAMSEMIL